MFPGFALEHVDVGPVRLRVRHGGSGPPVVLLHGHPRTHATWHLVAPLLADRFTVICPDLRGYGGSSKPPAGPDHAGYAKRAMAADVVGLLDALGHDRAAVVGHDRGCYAAMRTALDHPGRVSRLGVLDGVPIGEALARCDARFAARWWHWFFLAQSDKPAERVINADPDAWYGGSPTEMGAEAYADYHRAIHDPATVHAMCEDYRAGLGPDRAADEADRAAGRRIDCPVLFCFSTRDDMAELYGDPAAIWREWAPDLRVASVDSGHHMAEEAPEQLAAVLAAFLAGGGA
ncbi:alpha/beta fold hydrolase [Micromonospora sp. 4G55]|uniref:alpha/beta fold hydrolase n=1 Tax=Micromonospora sp. 4G55 TaxID=2806102 RepID=UPI001A47A91F|nr:alpha/beta hydrolase [Micromonospora sp. 4G55]MBM0258696.1 alpha/beta hydrolase [Micromonospora sp. 4G55]